MSCLQSTKALLGSHVQKQSTWEPLLIVHRLQHDRLAFRTVLSSFLTRRRLNITKCRLQWPIHSAWHINPSGSRYASLLSRGVAATKPVSEP